MTGGAGPQRDEDERTHPIQRKRKIFVGVIQPKELNGDIIYVTLTHERKDVAYILSNADAISLIEFKHLDYSKEAMPSVLTTHTTNLVADINGYFHIPYDTFLEMLKEENNAIIDYTPAIEDAMTLTQKVGQLEKEVNLLKEGLEVVKSIK